MFSWNYLETIDHFILCIPLKIGATIIAVLGILYGFLATYLFISMWVNFDSWKAVYVSKLDELWYFCFLFAITTIVLIVSIVLTFGIWLEEDVLVLIYLWSIAVYIVLNWLIHLTVSVYCIFINQSCFLGSGIGEVWVGFVLAMAFTAVWFYFLVIVNSYRVDSC